MKKVTHICDIKGCEEEIDDKMMLQRKMQVIFTTEQTEGRSIIPYFSIEELDLCKDHLNQAIDGNYIFANGAMGHNEYYFPKKK